MNQALTTHSIARFNINTLIDMTQSTYFCPLNKRCLRFVQNSSRIVTHVKLITLRKLMVARQKMYLATYIYQMHLPIMFPLFLETGSTSHIFSW